MSLCVCKGDVFLLLLYQNSLDFASCWLGCPNFKLQKKKEIPEGISFTSYKWPKETPDFNQGRNWAVLSIDSLFF